MSTEQFDLTEPEGTTDDCLVLDDPPFGPDTTTVVTDAVSGLGQSTAVALAANDRSVIGADIDEGSRQETTDIVDDLHGPDRVHSVPTDLTDDGVIGHMSAIHGHNARQDTLNGADLIWDDGYTTYE